MPRRKVPARFKYTGRKGDDLYVKFPLPGLKYPVWRKCVPETQERVNEIIAHIKNDIARRVADSAIPDRCDNFFRFWLSWIKNRVSERTLQNREAVVRLYLLPALGFFALNEVKPVQLAMIYDQMLAGGLSPVTARKVHAVASSIFKEAVNLELIASNPVSKTKPPRITDSLKIKVMNSAEVKRFVEACHNSQYGIIFEFALETGMRPQEYLALRWTDIDFEKRTADVVRALVYDRKGGGYYFKEPKTRKSRRTIPLSSQICDKLRIHLENQNNYLAEIRERIRRRCKPSRKKRREYNKQILENHKKLNLVFPSLDFTPFRDINLGRRYFKPIAKAAGLDKSLTTYSLRHSCATLLLSANVNPKIVAERLGHSNISTTLQIYSHVLPAMQSDATEKLSAILY